MIIDEFFTDLECTKPATKVGDLVAVWRRRETDNEITMIQELVSKRPVLQVNAEGVLGAAFYSSPDGLDCDYMEAPPIL